MLQNMTTLWSILCIRLGKKEKKIHCIVVNLPIFEYLYFRIEKLFLFNHRNSEIIQSEYFDIKMVVYSKIESLVTMDTITFLEGKRK